MAAESLSLPEQNADPTTDTAARQKVLGIVRRFSEDTAGTELDHLIHDRIRLGIVSALAVNPTLTFTELKRLLATSDGNLSVHARKLEDAGFVNCCKSFDGRKPRTDYALTETGRNALERYLAHMESLIKAVRDSEAIS